MTTLGISLGTRTLGMAITTNNFLIDWQVHHFKEKWSSKKLKRILGRIERKIARYEATKVVIKLPPETKISDGTALILEATKDSCLIKEVQVILTDIEELKQLTKCENKDELIEYAMSHNHELRVFLGRKNSRQRNYYLPAVEAVVAAQIIN